MDYNEVLETARTKIGTKCKACPICNGVACRNTMPGPGAKGIGDTAIRNYQKWQEIRVNMDTICEKKQIDTGLELFGKHFSYPFFAGPVGAIAMHYSNAYSDVTYNEVLVSACAENGIAAFTGDGLDSSVMAAALLKCEVPLVTGKGAGLSEKGLLHKQEAIKEKLALVKESGAFAVAMDIDAAGLPFLQNMMPPAGSKSVSELAEIAQQAGVPFIVKGIMTAKAALKAQQAGAHAIIVSNHGGRVLDQCAATAEVLPEIAAAVDGKMRIIVDGGIRSGVDIFKALALGADAVIIARPFVTAVFGGGKEGVKVYIEKLAAELKDTMAMCGAFTLKEITSEMVRRS